MPIRSYIDNYGNTKFERYYIAKPEDFVKGSIITLNKVYLDRTFWDYYNRCFLNSVNSYMMSIGELIDDSLGVDWKSEDPFLTHTGYWQYFRANPKARKTVNGDILIDKLVVGPGSNRDYPSMKHLKGQLGMRLTPVEDIPTVARNSYDTLILTNYSAKFYYLPGVKRRRKSFVNSFDEFLALYLV